MGRSSFLSILLVFLFISLCFTNGLGRKMSLVETIDTHHGYTAQVKENGENWRRMMMMMDTMDYSDPEPNTNIRGGYVSPPPPPPPPPPPING